MHRCGRTARIGKDGSCISLLSPDDNKAFKSICQVLKKSEDQIQLFPVKYSVLDKVRPLIEQTKDLEKKMHKTRQDEKAANWMLTAAKDADLALDDEAKYEI